MELALSLGDASRSLPSFLSNTSKTTPMTTPALDFRIPLGLGGGGGERNSSVSETRKSCEAANGRGGSGSSDSSSLLQLDLLPFSPVPRSCNSSTSDDRPGNGSLLFPLPWLAEHLGSEPESLSGRGRNLDVNQFPAAMTATEDPDDAAAQSSPNSAVSSFQTEFGIAIAGGSKRSETECDADRDCSRGSDDDENGLTRKKLRLSKDQSAFLEENFKEQSTLNPKQKIALAKQLNLRPRQVEVWFQNRRARTKLKQTEIDYEYLKRCCEKLTEENRRLQKELQELRALKSAPPFYMQLPATTLTMCPSCASVSTTVAAGTGASPLAAVSRPRPRSFPVVGGGLLGQGQGQAQGQQLTSDHLGK